MSSDGDVSKIDMENYPRVRADIVEGLAARDASASGTASPPIDGEPTEATSAKQWKVGKLIPLPSGNAIRVRDKSLITLMRTGVIPNILLEAAQDMVEGEMALGKDAERTRQYFEVLDRLIIEMVIEPKIYNPWATPDRQARDDEIDISDVSDVDKNFIFKYTQEGIRALERFRAVREGSQPGHGSEAVRDETKPDSGTSE